LKVAIYARYSSDNQREASIADQLRVCREFAARQGWTVVEEFTDYAISGATLLRSGFQALMRDALNRRFDVVLAEALDRFSRDQEDTAGLFKRLTFADVNIVTLAEGDITQTFRDYAAGLSPKALAKRLNAERCPGPGGSPWNPAPFTAIPRSPECLCCAHERALGEREYRVRDSKIHIESQISSVAMPGLMTKEPE
jgi:hypothetical protein